MKSWNLESQFLVAIQNGDQSQVNSLLEQGLDPDIRFHLGRQKRPALCLCVERDNTDLVKILIKWGCSINQFDSTGLTALHIAAGRGNVKMVKLLLDKNAHVNAITSQHHSPLHIASQRRSIDVVQLLVDGGAEVNRIDQEGKTPLLNACIQGNSQVVDYLVKQGADVNACSPCGSSPLLFVANAPCINLDLLSILLEAGADANHQNAQGEAPVHAVLRSRRTNRIEALSLLFSYKCDLNAGTRLGHAPLHLSVLENDKLAVVKLLQFGCDCNLMDKLGLTPLFYAIREGNADIVSLLLSAGAQFHRNLWFSDERMLASLRNPDLLKWLNVKRSECPRLIDICRVALRTWWGCSNQEQIRRSHIPLTVKHYLMFETT